MPAFNDPSDRGLTIQWPIAQTAAPDASPTRRVRLGVMASGSGSNFEAVAPSGLSGSGSPASSTITATSRAARPSIRP